MARVQKGTIVQIASRWFVRFYECRNIGGTIVRKRVSHSLGAVTTRGTRPPAQVMDEAKKFMITVNNGQLPAERILTMEDFAESVYIPWVGRYQRPSTLKGYRQVWMQHLKPHCEKTWLKDVRTFHVQGWLNAIARNSNLSRNSLRRIQSVLSGMFALAKQLGYFDLVNPVQDSRIDPTAAEPAETYAYTLEAVNALLNLLPEPAATVFAAAAFMGLRIGEIEALQWQDFRDGEMHISRSIWNGHVGSPKTRTSAAPVPVMRQLFERLEIHRLLSQNPNTGPIFANGLGKPMNMNNMLKRVILPVLNRCALCGGPRGRGHVRAGHIFVRDARLPQWHGWHAARRGLGSNLYRLGVPPMVIQRILRHSNVSTTANYYIKTAADDVRKAMKDLEMVVPENHRSDRTDSFGTPKLMPATQPESIN